MGPHYDHVGMKAEAKLARILTRTGRNRSGQSRTFRIGFLNFLRIKLAHLGSIFVRG